MRYKYLFLIMVAVIAASMVLTACGTPAPATPAPAPRTWNLVNADGTETATVIYDGANWSCSTNYAGASTTPCKSEIGATVNFFYGIEKFATTNVGGKLDLLNEWREVTN